MRKKNSKEKNKDKKKKLFLIKKSSILILVMVTLACFIPAAYNYKRYLQLSEKETEIINNIEKEKKIKESLLKEKKYQDSDEYIMNIAQKELNMLKPDQMKIIVETK